LRTRVQKWGNSLAVRIPKHLASEAGLDVDVSVDMSVSDGKIMLESVGEPSVTLASLLDEITEDNLHDELDTGARVGREVW